MTKRDVGCDVRERVSGGGGMTMRGEISRRRAVEAPVSFREKKHVRCCLSAQYTNRAYTKPRSVPSGGRTTGIKKFRIGGVFGLSVVNALFPDF